MTPNYSPTTNWQRFNTQVTKPLVAACLVLGVLSAPASFAWQKNENAIEERGATEIAQCLVDARHEVLSANELPSKLSRGRAKAIPEIFELLCRGRYDVRIGERGNTTRKLTLNEREALVAALGILQWSDVKKHVDERLEEEPKDRERVAALRILEGLGDEKHLWNLLRWSEPEDPKARVSGSVRRSFAKTLATLLARSPRGIAKMSDIYSSTQLSLVPSVISVLGANESRESLDELTQFLGKVRGADALVLAEISHLGAQVSHPIERKTRDRVRVYLSNADHSLQVEGILACGRLEDVDAVPQLIELLTDGNPSVMKRSLSSLKEITHQLYGYDPTDWNEWLGKVTKWRNERSTDLLNDAASGSHELASRAVLECSKQRFYRHELAPTLALCLDRPQEELIILTCAALGHLGSPLTVPNLRRCLDHSSTDVKRAALLALRRVTGEDHGEESRAWADAGW